MPLNWIARLETEAGRTTGPGERWIDNAVINTGPMAGCRPAHATGLRVFGLGNDDDEKSRPRALAMTVRINIYRNLSNSISRSPQFLPCSG